SFGEVADSLLVLDDEGCGGGQRFDACLGRRDADRSVGLNARQKQSQAGALTRRALDTHLAPRLRREAVYLAEAEAGALARTFRREEGFEDAIDGLNVHAGAGVLQSDGDHGGALVAAFDCGANG